MHLLEIKETMFAKIGELKAISYNFIAQSPIKEISLLISLFPAGARLMIKELIYLIIISRDAKLI